MTYKNDTITYDGTEYRVTEANGELRATKLGPEERLQQFVKELMGGAKKDGNDYLSGSLWHFFGSSKLNREPSYAGYLCLHTWDKLPELSNQHLPDGFTIACVKPARENVGDRGIGIYFDYEEP